MRCWLLAIAALTSACDIGPREDAAGPPLHLVATYPADGQGTNAAPGSDVACDTPTPDCAVPTDVAIELRFDRLLIPGVGLNAGLSLYTGNPPANGVALNAKYDLFERVVVYRPSRLLQPNTLYTVQVVPSDNPSQGFWALDRSALAEEGSLPLRFSFSTGSGPRGEPPLPPGPEDTCETMLQGPLRACGTCHRTDSEAKTGASSAYPPMGLDLSSSSGFFYTAIRQVAHQTETGNRALEEGLQSPARFGVQMNIVDPGSPGTSYLIYKLLQKPENFGLSGDAPRCVTGYHSPVSDLDCQPPPEAERARLREWFVRGDPMPKDARAESGESVPAFVTREDLLRISSWIAGGARCPEPY